MNVQGPAPSLVLETREVAARGPIPDSLNKRQGVCDPRPHLRWSNTRAVPAGASEAPTMQSLRQRSPQGLSLLWTSRPLHRLALGTPPSPSEGRPCLPSQWDAGMKHSGMLHNPLQVHLCCYQWQDFMLLMAAQCSILSISHVLIHPSISGGLHSLAAVNDAAVNTGPIYLSRCVFIVFGYIRRRATAES